MKLTLDYLTKRINLQGTAGAEWNLYAKTKVIQTSRFNDYALYGYCHATYHAGGSSIGCNDNGGGSSGGGSGADSSSGGGGGGGGGDF
ncbi:hypothetical protein PS15m_011443 [Mucor circinelloides]